MRGLKLCYLSESAQRCQLLHIDRRVALRRRLDLSEPSMNPLLRIGNHPRAHHVQIDIHQTAVQMTISLDRRRMIAILPERAFALLALVVLLGSTTSDELHAVGNHLCIGVSDQQVNVIRSHDVVEHL